MSEMSNLIKKKPVILIFVGIFLTCCLCCAVTVGVVAMIKGGGGGNPTYRPTEDSLLPLIERHVGTDNTMTPSEYRPTNVYVARIGECNQISPTAQARGVIQAWIVEYSYDRGNNGNWVNDEALVINKNGLWDVERIPRCP